MYSQVPTIETQRSSQVSDMPDSESKGDLLVNNLVYKQPKNLSLAKCRTHVKQFFQRSDYPSAPNKTAIIDWNTGSSYIDVGNSYLSLTVTALNDGLREWSFGKGSAMNLISRITIRSRSGTELERLEGANLWSKLDLQYSMPQSFRDTMGSAMGMGDDTKHNQYNTTVIGSGTVNKIPLLIPLKVLCPFFRPLKGQLMPPMLASGLHIEIVFENTNTVFVNNTVNAITDYNVEDINFILDTVDLSDETQKAINMESADNGLEWVCPRIHTTLTSIPVGQGQVSVQIRKAVSQAVMVYSVLQDSADITDQKVDSFRSKLMLANTTWQYRIGSLFFPQQPVVETVDAIFPASYYEALYSFDKPKHPYNECSVNIREFQQDSSIFAMTASKNDDLFLSGLPINNSRCAEFNLTTTSTNTNKQLTSFLEYICVVKLFVDNCAVAL